MADYKFEILSELVKHDDFIENNKLFGERTKKYEDFLQDLYEQDLIDREIMVGDVEIYKTKITKQGRNYYFDELLPKKQRHSAIETSAPIHKDAKTIGMKIYDFINKYIVVIIFGLLGAIASYFTIFQFFIDNNWFNLGKK